MFRSSSLELDADKRLAAQVQRFRPDAVLQMRLVSSLADRGGNSMVESYVLSLAGASGQPVIWRGTARLVVGMTLDFGARVDQFTDGIVDAMARDGALKGCAARTG